MPQSFCLWTETADCSLTRVAYKNYISLCCTHFRFDFVLSCDAYHRRRRRIRALHSLCVWVCVRSNVRLCHSKWFIFLFCMGHPISASNNNNNSNRTNEQKVLQFESSKKNIYAFDGRAKKRAEKTWRSEVVADISYGVSCVANSCLCVMRFSIDNIKIKIKNENELNRKILWYPMLPLCHHHCHHSRAFSFSKVFFFICRLRFCFRLWNVAHTKRDRGRERESRRAKEIERVENVHFICHKFSRLRFHIFLCATWTAAAAQSVAFSVLISCGAQPRLCVRRCVYARAVMSSENCIFFNSCFKYFSSSRCFFSSSCCRKNRNQPTVRDKMLVYRSKWVCVCVHCSFKPNTDCQTQFHFSLCHSIRGKAKSIRCL